MYRKALTSDSLSTHGFFLGKNFPSPPLDKEAPPKFNWHALTNDQLFKKPQSPRLLALSKADPI